MVYDCDICGCTGFRNPGALASHKTTSRACRLSATSREEVDDDVKPQVDVQDQPSGFERQTAHEYISMVDPLFSSLSTTPIGNHVEDVLCTPLSEFYKASQPAYRFDSTLHLVAFIRQCRNTMGLSMKDTRRLLSLLFHTEFSLTNIDVKNVSDLLNYEKRIASTHTITWKQVTVRPKDNHVPELVLHYQIQWMSCVDYFQT